MDSSFFICFHSLFSFFFFFLTLLIWVWLLHFSSSFVCLLFFFFNLRYNGRSIDISLYSSLCVSMILPWLLLSTTTISTSTTTTIHRWSAALLTMPVEDRHQSGVVEEPKRKWNGKAKQKETKTERNWSGPAMTRYHCTGTMHVYLPPHLSLQATMISRSFVWFSCFCPPSLFVCFFFFHFVLGAPARPWGEVFSFFL